MFQFNTEDERNDENLLKFSLEKFHIKPINAVVGLFIDKHFLVTDKSDFHFALILLLYRPSIVLYW